MHLHIHIYIYILHGTLHVEAPQRLNKIDYIVCPEERIQDLGSNRSGLEFCVCYSLAI